MLSFRLEELIYKLGLRLILPFGVLLLTCIATLHFKRWIGETWGLFCEPSHWSSLCIQGASNLCLSPFFFLNFIFFEDTASLHSSLSLSLTLSLSHVILRTIFTFCAERVGAFYQPYWKICGELEEIEWWVIFFCSAKIVPVLFFCLFILTVKRISLDLHIGQRLHLVQRMTIPNY